MYQANVVPIVGYSSSVWGYANYDFCVKVQYRAIRYFLRVHLKAPLLGLDGDMGWEKLKWIQTDWQKEYLFGTIICVKTGVKKLNKYLN